MIEELPLRPVPAFDLGTHRLRIEGRVERPLDLAPADLEAIADEPLVADFVCTNGWTVPGLEWGGVPVQVLLDRAGAAPAVQAARISAPDTSVDIPIEEFRGALLAVRLNGDPLTVEHGAPIRLVVPGGACIQSVKWVQRIELL